MKQTLVLLFVCFQHVLVYIFVICMQPLLPAVELISLVSKKERNMLLQETKNKLYELINHTGCEVRET